MVQEKEYQEAIEWIFIQTPNYQKQGKGAYKPGLGNISRLCDFFGNPQKKLKCIHIGGTNGSCARKHCYFDKRKFIKILGGKT